MVAVGLAVFVIVVKVLRELCIGVVEVGCIGVIDIIVLGGVFFGGGGGRSGTGGRVCCEASPVVCKWERIFFVLF